MACDIVFEVFILCGSYIFAYVLNVNERFVMRIIPHTNVDFICM
jgi:hypothetical protein